jgi:cystathionine beta-lyase
MGQICLNHNCLVFSDEIHCDFIFPPHRHQVFAALSPELADISVIGTAPSKTFNLAGLQISNLFISNPMLKAGITEEIKKSGFSQLNTMGLAACQAAYDFGQQWLTQLMAYLTGNLNYTREFFQKYLSPLKLIEPQGTYLLWFDGRDLGLAPGELNKFIIHKARLWLDDGAIFGAGGEGFQRINMACPRSTLQNALERLALALK